ncbi:nucleotidyltransferase family protein [Methylolobus aquaticus]
MNASTHTLAPHVAQAARRFTAALAQEFDVADALVFGSQARGESRPDSDVDIAVLLHGTPGRRVDAALRMAAIAFDVLLETGVVIEPLPLWEDEWIHPERFANPALLERIRREGIVL